MRVLTHKGFREFSSVSKIEKAIVRDLELSDGTVITCTEGHLLRRDDDSFSELRALSIGDDVDGRTVRNIGEPRVEAVYDLHDVAETHSYLTNGVTSHNCAFIEGWDEFFASVYPTISSGNDTKLMMTSTPNGLNHFFYICENAKLGPGDPNWNGYHYVEVKWDRVPGRDAAWKQRTLQSLNFDLAKFNVEYEAEFMGSSGTLLSTAALKSLKHHDSVFESGGLKIFEHPERDKTYVLVADVSRGKGLDYSAFHVIDVTEMPYKQVATFRDNFVTPVDYASIIFQAAKRYNEALVLIEINDIGAQVADALFFEYEYEGVLSTENSGRAGKRISGGFGSKTERGIRTTKTVKSVGCSMLKLIIEQRQIEIVDAATISELQTFSKRAGSYQAEPGHHDDMVMGLVLFAWLTTQPFFREITDINTISRLRDNTDDHYAEMMPVLTYDDVFVDNSEAVILPRESWISW